jgi:uncharacterized membrane protein YfcA
MILAYLLIGVFAGVMAGIFGIGGGIVIVPALLFFARLPLKTAIGTSLAALLLPVGAFGVWTYWKDGHVEAQGALLIAAGLLVGIYAGSLFAQMLSEAALRKAFALLLVGVAVNLWLKG